MAVTATDPIKETKKRGRRKVVFGPAQMSEFASLVRSGFGRVVICRRMKVSYHTFLRIYEENPRFAESIREAELSRMEACESALFRIATCIHNDPLAMRAANSYLVRRDRLKENRLLRRERQWKADGAARTHSEA